MSEEPYYKAHWREIDADRMTGYKNDFRWDDAAERLYADADIQPGHVVADFGCGPVWIALELARRVGPNGHVHGLDINADFIVQARGHAREAALEARMTHHVCDGQSLPIADASLDRITARNTLMYVDDAECTLRAFYRALRPGGLAHAIDGDWRMMVAEPISPDLWSQFVTAAAVACRHADMGRKLHAAFRAAGFTGICVRVQAPVDLQGRLLGMIRNMSKYARENGLMESSRIRQVVETAEQAHASGTLMIVSPQFVVTGVRPA